MKIGFLLFVFGTVLAISSFGQQTNASSLAKVYVTGSVKRAGPIDYSSGLTLHNAVELVGGVTIKNKSRWVCIYRRQPGWNVPQVIPIRFNFLSSNKYPEFELQEFDIVEILRNKKGCSTYRHGDFFGLSNRTPIPIP
jgi:protein involved in polysaccharide export with SLBB domain